MRFLMNRYFADPEMAELRRWLFALAAYNAGPARIQRLRKQAAVEGYDPNVWLGGASRNEKPARLVLPID